MKNNYFTKFCGITRLKDALNAEKTGCNALGFVFVKSSKRYINSQQCNDIIDKLSPTTMVVALFANNTEIEIQHVLDSCKIHVLQFHGNESADFCKKWNRPYWKAVPMADAIDPIEYAASYPHACGFIIDNFGQGQAAGSGKKFDWQRISNYTDNKWILAGGLNPKNIKQANQMTGIRCYDVSSGIEKSAGIKSNKKMKKFIQQLND